MNARILPALIAAVTMSQAQPPPAAPARPAPQPILPVAATVLAANPDRYVGSNVSMTAAVDQQFGANAFSVDQDSTKHGTGDILVLASVMVAPVEPDSYVTVIGEVVRFDVGTIAARMKDAMPALTGDVIEKYRGHPAIIATSVINSAMVDLAKRPPAPMSPEEAALSKVMKQIGPGFNTLRQAVTASNSADATAQAAALKKGFADAAAFWKTKTHPDATEWNENARLTAEAIETAVAHGDWDAAKATVPKLQGSCSSCHERYRERLEDGTYRFKQAGK
jgi:cytochrome c556